LGQNGSHFLAGSVARILAILQVTARSGDGIAADQGPQSRPPERTFNDSLRDTQHARHVRHARRAIKRIPSHPATIT